MKRPKISSLAARLETRQALADARQASHARATVVVAALERAYEVRSLDVEILDFERLLARISETQKPEHHRLRFGPFKLDLVISDRAQLQQLVAVLKTWRQALLGSDGEARIALAERLASELARTQAVGATDPGGHDDPPPVNGLVPVSRWGA